MRRLRRILLAIVLIVVVAAVGGYWYERPMLRTGTGYAAHNACALDAIAGRTNAGDDLPPNPLVPVLRWSTDGNRTTASILGVLAKQHAWATDGFGCTVGDTAPRLPDPAVVSGRGRFETAEPGKASAAVTAALDKAFGMDLAAADRSDLGTRAVVVLKDGKLVAERYADGFTKDTPQLGWSMTKSVASLVVGRLVLQGKTSLDDDHLWPTWKDERASITIRQLMQMTSGLAWDETYALNTAITKMLYVEPDMARFVASADLAHSPGTHVQYSSGSTNLLCGILAAKNGGANLPRLQVFAPLGLTHAVMEPDGVGTPVCSSYMWATPREWATIGQFALQDGVWDDERLLPEGWMAQTTTAVDVESEEDNPYAMGWWPNRRPDGALRAPNLPADAYFAQGHDGQRITVVPSEKVVVVRLGFTPTRDDDRAIEVAGDLVAALR